MRLLRQLPSNLRSRRWAHLGVVFVAVFVAVSNHFSFVALAASPAVLAAPALKVTQSACSIEGCPSPVAVVNDARLSLPKGLEQCANSGPAAACASAWSPADYVPGSPAVPAGQASCSTGAKSVPATPAACTDTVLPPVAPARTGADGAPIVQPSLPTASLGTPLPSRIELTSNAETVGTDHPVTLTATASSTVTGTDLAIEIFDRTTGTLIAACGQGSQCAVAYSAMSGIHDFAAYVALPTRSIPDDAVALGSNHVRVGWLDTGIAASGSVVGQGQSVTITATSTIDVQKTGRWLEIYDLTAKSRITYCSRGTSCTTSIKLTGGGRHDIVGYVNGAPESASDPISVTWLDVSLSATSVGPKTGGTIYLKATTNADLGDTPWVIGIYDEQGRLVDHACKTGNTCVVQAWMSGGNTPRYTAVIGALADAKPSARITPTTSPSALVDVQARSTPVEPSHLLWGVDSCKAFVGDVTGDLYPKVVKHLGTPDFWGRYLTNTVCPGISAAEVALAASQHMGILPIYNDYDCSAVVHYATGQAYAAEAVAAAQRLGIPRGRLLAIDIEPPGAACPGAGGVDAGFITGWYDGVRQAGYVPVYYGNGTRGTEFATAWCAAVAASPQIANGSALWSFQPSLLGRFTKEKAPGWSPYSPGCPGNMEAWQYVLSADNAIDVDQDEALSSLPIWYP
ncbi:MAG TPA: glycoside hydrolase domain-containing protein [Candidatus Dormibacteraeota bacterium]